MTASRRKREPVRAPVPASQEPERVRLVECFTWRGIEIEVGYEADWLNSSQGGFAASHLEVRALRPENARLPITETGYRSHFLAPGTVESAGGPVAYVTAGLDHEAAKTAWRTYEEANRQLSLF